MTTLPPRSRSLPTLLVALFSASLCLAIVGCSGEPPPLTIKDTSKTREFMQKRVDNPKFQPGGRRKS